MNGPAALASTSATAGPYLVSKLRVLDARLQEVEPRVREAHQDAAACHDLRVALRRTRTVLEIGRPVLGRFHAEEVRRALRDLQRATGALRDEEVLLEVVTSLGVDRPDVAAWIEARRRREHAQRLALVHLVRDGHLQRGRELLRALLTFRIDPARDRRLAKFAKRAIDRARREVERQRAAGLDDASALHDLRIAYKRLRYTAEALADALPNGVAQLAPASAKIQKRLGDVHDVDVAIGAVRRARTLTPEGRADLLAALYRLRENRISAYARELGLSLSPSVPPAERQAVGNDSLRKISTR